MSVQYYPVEDIDMEEGAFWRSKEPCAVCQCTIFPADVFLTPVKCLDGYRWECDDCAEALALMEE